MRRSPDRSTGGNLFVGIEFYREVFTRSRSDGPYRLESSPGKFTGRFYRRDAPAATTRTIVTGRKVHGRNRYRRTFWRDRRSYRTYRSPGTAYRWIYRTGDFTGRLYRVIGTSDTNGGRAKMVVGIDFYRDVCSRRPFDLSLIHLRPGRPAATSQCRVSM